MSLITHDCGPPDFWGGRFLGLHTTEQHHERDRRRRGGGAALAAPLRQGWGFFALGASGNRRSRRQHYPRDLVIEHLGDCLRVLDIGSVGHV
jgi:hypothetical protein